MPAVPQVIPLPHVFAALGSLLLLYAVNVLVRAALTRRKLPPGPPGLPVLGNIWDVKGKAWLQYSAWARQYGPIFSLNMAGTPIIVLNTHKVAANLLDRRSTIYSDRTQSVMAGEILTGGVFLVFTPYGELWRRMRRASHEEFSFTACKKYQPVQTREAYALVSDLLADPRDWREHLMRSAASSILSALYGWDRLKPDDHLVHRIHEHTGRIASSVLPGRFMVEYLPFLKHIPSWTGLVPWKVWGETWHKRDTAMFEEFVDSTTANAQKGDPNAAKSFVAGLVENQERHGLSKKHMAWLAGNMFGAGAETTAGQLIIFVLAMILHPEVQARAQAEIDAVVGRDRAPTFADRDRLPYIRACVRETLRWRTVGPLGVPRATSQDDWYEGYYIPKGAVVLENIWAMNSDPNVFPDYNNFRPERFLDESGQNEIAPPDTHNMGHVTYGFGRRICAGYNFANQSLFIDLACLLWAFNFRKAKDERGQEITPDPDDMRDGGLVVTPPTFPCEITPRHPDVASVIERERMHMV
ncbi:cytochrome P450 [Lentinus tigrinus ALCF2SS1-7]|nr:cytochrome P450 [Lentinus tigrinus ALCF2SS1-7]